MHFIQRLSGFALLACILAGCNSGPAQSSFPKDAEDVRKESRGKLTGEGLSFGGSGDKESGGASPIGVNSFLWRATLDTLSFMPLASADPFGGVVITDWYEDPQVKGERFKVNALILDRSLRADGIRISLFKQRLEKGAWKDQPVDAKLARQLEDTILTRARQLKVAQSK